MQVFIGDVFGNRGIVTFKNDRGLIAARRKVAVQAVGRNIQRAVFIPFDIKIMRVIADIFDLGVRLDPVNALAMFAPEAFRVINRLLVHGIVFGLVDQGAFGDFLGDGINVRRHC